MTVSRLLFRTAVLCAIPLSSARADSGWDGLGMFFYFGVVPLLALLAAFLLSLFISRAPRLHKLWAGIAIAASLLLLIILSASHTLNPPPFLFWLLPAAAWWATAQGLLRFTRQRGARRRN
jgi:hypothetical protein